MSIVLPVEPVPPSQRPATALAESAGLQPPADVGANAFLAEATVPADASRQKLLSFMVHEIRNPLASALWSAEMLARQQLADPRAAKMAQLSARSVRRLRALIEDLFALERLPATAPVGACDLRAAVDSALAPHDVDPKQIEAHVEGDAGIQVELDPALVGKLVHACLRRAASVGEGGSLKIRVEASGDAGLITIFRDGVTPAVLDPPVLQSAGSEGAGTTFALLFARAAAQRLGAALWVEASGAGTNLCLRFPLAHPSH